MLIDIFVIPSSGKAISEAGFKRLVNSCDPDLCNNYVIVRDIADVNLQTKTCPFYGVFFDNEYFDPRLVNGIKHFILYSRGIDMICVFEYRQGLEEIKFRPRIFLRNHQLNPDLKYSLPLNADFLTFEKILDGWLYCD